MTDSTSVAIIGAGLVGSMLACYLGRRGYQVDLFEMRPDLRQQPSLRGKSINLALSIRGLEALKRLGLDLDKLIDENCIPMYGRLIHDTDGKLRDIPYGHKGQCINSISRRRLNELLLNFAETNASVRMHFEHKLINANLDEGECCFKSTTTAINEQESTENDEISKHRSDIIIGADGAYSSVRTHLMKRCRFNFSQQYIDHGYIELTIPPKIGEKPTMEDEFAMPANYLHIWPRGQFMMIALPNQDRSFTLTLFMPFAKFDQIQAEHQLMRFFEDNFLDSIALIGRKQLVKTFFENRPASLISINCSPIHFEDRCLLIGDAAHAMVPFFGQGMNCGFEDVVVLDELLDSMNGKDFKQAFSEYSANRVRNCRVICDLAMYNYIEMRDLVNNFSFLLRKKADLLLNLFLGSLWIPLYSMVTFSRIPYSECMRKKKRQDRIIAQAITLMRDTFFVLFAYLIYRFYYLQH